MPDYLALALSVGALLSMIFGWFRWWRPRIHKARSDGVAMRDAILGRDPIVDSITGKELAPPLPGIGVRMAHQETQMELLTTAVTQIADSHRRIETAEKRIDRHDDEIAVLKAAAMERVMTRAESTQAWSAMESAIKARTDEDE